jgi:hypothetical protein
MTIEHTLECQRCYAFRTLKTQAPLKYIYIYCQRCDYGSEHKVVKSEIVKIQSSP